MIFQKKVLSDLADPADIVHRLELDRRMYRAANAGGCYTKFWTMTM